MIQFHSRTLLLSIKFYIRFTLPFTCKSQYEKKEQKRREKNQSSKHLAVHKSERETTVRREHIVKMNWEMENCDDHIKNKLESDFFFAILYSCISFFVVNLYKKFSVLWKFFEDVFADLFRSFSAILTSLFNRITTFNFSWISFQLFLHFIFLLILFVISRKWKSWEGKCKANKIFVGKFTKSNNNRVFHFSWLFLLIVVGALWWWREICSTKNFCSG